MKRRHSAQATGLNSIGIGRNWRQRGKPTGLTETGTDNFLLFLLLNPSQVLFRTFVSSEPAFSHEKAYKAVRQVIFRTTTIVTTEAKDTCSFRVGDTFEIGFRKF